MVAIKWTPGRIVFGLAMILVAVPLGLNLLEPRVRSECGTTPDQCALAAGICLLAMRLAWRALKTLNHAFERWFATLTSPKSRPKPQPLDDF